MPSPPSKDEIGPDGLSLLERHILQELALGHSIRQTAANLHLSPRQVRYRFQANPKFKEAYDKLFTSEDIKVLKQELSITARDVADVYSEAKEAELEKDVPAECPECGHKFTLHITLPNWNIRLKAADTLIKMLGLLKDEKSVKFEGQMTHVTLSYAEQAALLRLKSGMGEGIPPHVMQRLRDVGALDKLALPEPAVDAEYREVDNDEDDPAQ